jgi:hypothetical protein
VYYHSVTGGSIIGYGDTVIWLAPDYEGTFYAGVLVTDHDGNQATDSISLVVKRLPTSTMVKGIAAFADSITFDLADAKVYLYNSLEDLENHNPAYQDSVSGFGPIVSFRFDNVPAGTYYLDIWKDMDFSNLRSIGDFLGWYGTGNISSPEPQPFLLEEGGTMYAQVRMWIIGQK